MVDTEINEYPTYLSDMFSTLIDWKPTQTKTKKIKVESVDDTWLIKVYTRKCRGCGHVITPREAECPSWSMNPEWDCFD